MPKSLTQSTFSEEIISSYKCHFTKKFMAEPVILISEGHTYEKEELEKWLSTKDTSPIEGLTLEDKSFVLNKSLQFVILKFLQDRPNFYEEDQVYLPQQWIQQLTDLITNNDIKKIDHFLKTKIDPRLLFVAINENNYTAFHIACEFSSPTMVDFLLKKYSEQQLQKITKSTPFNFNPIHLNTLLQQSLNDEYKVTFLCSLGAKFTAFNPKTQELIDKQSTKIVKLERLNTSLLGMYSQTLPPLSQNFNHETRYIDRQLEIDLLDIIMASRHHGDDSEAAIAASRAATILNRSKCSFSGLDLTGVNIAGADLSYGIFDNTIFINANLSDVNFHGAWLRETKFNGALMRNTKFVFEKKWQHSTTCFTNIAISNNRTLLAATRNEYLYIFNISDGKFYPLFEKKVGTSNILKLTFSHNDNMLAINYDDTNVAILNIFSKTLVLIEKLKHYISSLAFSMDDTKLAFDERNGRLIYLLDINSNKKTFFESDELLRHTVVKIYFHSDNQNVLLVLNSLNILSLNLNSGIFTVAYARHYDCSVAIKIDHQLLKSILDYNKNTICIWNLENKQRSAGMFNIQNQDDQIAGVSFSHDNQYIIISTNRGFLHIWKQNQDTEQPLATFECRFVIKKITWTKDDFLITKCANNSVNIWKLNNAPDNTISIQLLFSLSQTEFYMLNSSIDQAVGLSNDDIRSLKMHGATGEPAREKSEPQDPNAKMILLSYSGTNPTPPFSSEGSSQEYATSSCVLRAPMG